MPFSIISDQRGTIPAFLSSYCYLITTFPVNVDVWPAFISENKILRLPC